MIELPESRNLANQVKEHLLGKVVANAETNRSPHKFAWFSTDPANYHIRLNGKPITGANSYGGMVKSFLATVPAKSGSCSMTASTSGIMYPAIKFLKSISCV